jgi:hypothetical protein
MRNPTGPTEQKEKKERKKREPFKDEEQIALLKDPVRTAL